MTDAISAVSSRPPAAPIQPISRRFKAEDDQHADETKRALKVKQAQDARQAEETKRARQAKQAQDAQRAHEAKQARDDKRAEQAVVDEARRQPPPLRPAPAPGTGTIFDIDA